MTERIRAVQRVFWTLLAVSAVIVLLGVPLGDDGHTMAALKELDAFGTGFHRDEIERLLLSHASVQGVVGLDAVAQAIHGSGAPKVSAAKDAKPIMPHAAVSLNTLAQVYELTSPSAMLAIGSARAEGLASSLAWRLSRESGERYELQSIELGDGSCSAADVEREKQISDARAAAQKAHEQEKVADKQNTQAQEVYDLRRKWKATWKSILKANEKREETQAALDAAQQTRASADQKYEQLAKDAAGFGKGEGESGCAVAIAHVTERPSGKTLELHVPAAVDTRTVSVPPITGASFEVIRKAGLWDEIKDGSVDQARARLRARFSWHYRYLELAGMKLGGMTVLQLAPLALLPLFLGLIRRSRGVGATYNPFDRPPNEILPSVGVGTDAVNLVILVILPLAGCVLCAVSLWQIEQPPIVPVLCAIGTLGLGGSSHIALKDLLELRDAVTRSHSNPPPAPAR